MLFETIDHHTMSFISLGPAPVRVTRTSATRRRAIINKAVNNQYGHSGCEKIEQTINQRASSAAVMAVAVSGTTGLLRSGVCALLPVASSIGFAGVDSMTIRKPT